jgi:hypothetical protein
MDYKQLLAETIPEAIDTCCDILQKKLHKDGKKGTCESGLEELMDYRYLHGTAQINDSPHDEKKDVLYPLSKLLIHRSVNHDDDMLTVLIQSTALYNEDIFSKQELFDIELLIDRAITQYSFSKETMHYYSRFKEYLLDTFY